MQNSNASSERYDLHCHSTASDGELSPVELLKKAKNKGLTGISITDHDTVGAYTDETFAEASRLGLELIPGVEFSSYLGKEGIHVLGYFLDLSSPMLQAFCKKHQSRRWERNRKILKLLMQNNMPIDESELEEFTDSVVGRPHIAKLMSRHGYVKDEREAFRKYLSEGKPCFSWGTPISLDETLRLIHAAKGLAFLAHPILIKRKRIFEQALSYPFDGIECYYGNFERDKVEPFIKRAEENRLLKSGGSDYHGPSFTKADLGRSFITKELLELIKMRSTGYKK